MDIIIFFISKKWLFLAAKIVNFIDYPQNTLIIESNIGDVSDTFSNFNRQFL